MPCHWRTEVRSPEKTVADAVVLLDDVAHAEHHPDVQPLDVVGDPRRQSACGRWAGWLRSWHIPAGRGSPRRSTIRDSPARVAGIPPAPQRAGSTTWQPTPRGSLSLFSFFVPFICRAANHSTSRRFRKACVMVSSSTYSSSSPKPMPRAMEVTFTSGELPQAVHQVEERRLALDRGRDGEDHLLHAAAGDAFGQQVDLQIRRRNALHRRNDPAQHVVEPLVLARVLDRKHVGDLLHDADRRPVALVVQHRSGTPPRPKGCCTAAQYFTSLRKRSMLSVISATDSRSMRRMWMARRSAVRRPTPGSFDNSPTTSCSKFRHSDRFDFAALQPPLLAVGDHHFAPVVEPVR